MSARIREALTELERDVAGLRLAPPAAVRARGRARSRRRAAVLAGAAAVVVAGGAATVPGLTRPVTPAASGTTASATPSATGRCLPDAGAPARVDVVFRVGASAQQMQEANYRIGVARGEAGLRCGGQPVSLRPDRDGRFVASILLAVGEDPAPIQAAVAGLPGVERVVLPAGR
ncbi:hypothetical protein [Micromonospora sp. NPDC004551]|uniref:hypothetical protein n=1 Tax=Micromonospora sp. NPDC004551 TaxID=3154284 RepID=UPI0033A4E41C